MKKFIIRIRACYRILFRSYNHWVIINVDRRNLEKLLMDKEFDADLLYHGVQPYIYLRMIEMISNSTNDVDMICNKAEFEASAMEYAKNKK